MLKLGVFLAGASLTAAQVDAATHCARLLAECGNRYGFSTAPDCETAFSTMNPGTTGDVNVNSIACRNRFLTDSVLNATATKCQYSGPSGGGRCGSMVDGVCTVALANCGTITPRSYQDVASCQAGLAGLGAQWGAKQGAAAAGEDTLECRVYHTTAAVTTADISHCTHFNFSNSPCSAAPPVPDATHYCDVIMDACSTTATKQYSGMTECMKAANSFPTTPADARASNGMNSLGCREYHAQAAKAVNATVHCEHGGPSGAGVCGTQTQAWASLAKGICNDTDVQAVVMGLGEANLALAIPVGATQAFSTTSDVSKNTQVCRIYHLQVAATLPTHCSHGSISGDGNCGTNVAETFCNFAGGICGFGTDATYQFASFSACNTSVGAIAIGTSADRTQNTLGCRIYHVGVAGSYKTGGANAADATAAAKLKEHCGHTLAMANTGGCGAATVTTAPSASKSPAAAISAFAATVVAMASTLAL